MTDSVTINALTSAADGLAARNRAINNNIANINTPNFQASRVQFEDQLRASVAAGDGAADYTSKLSLEPTRHDGNNVNLDTETVSAIDTVLRYQFATQAINDEFKSVRSVLGTS
ncbi:flagellar basal body rod protein FlgB [Leifsonia sp. Leaf264]|uniref:flagellar basal body rod protein FlgB n=1 Tax=Leifsonia sp. Leaf264 TaxID=1736314 RepID=UPI0006F6A342|nr:hypothetical protein [Leifsonia sp. Leaf264]KQO98229.1 flagellar biosynthesis protein FlgB [Leifsonia sp. Leaf264]